MSHCDGEKNIYFAPSNQIFTSVLRKLHEKQLFDGPAIGIDLGTTFSCVSVYREGRAEIIIDKSGDRLIPSIVYYDPNSGKVSIGKDALDEEPKCYGNCIRDVKRILGRRFNDEFIKNYIRKGDIAFKIVQGENDEAVFEVEIDKEVVTKTPEEVSAEILNYLKEMASNYLDQNISKVVITVPAYFSNAQRISTKKAAELAGLEVLKFITEPSAAGSHYVKDKRFSGKIMVFDWGGGTLDISYVQVENNIFDVKAVYGDTQLGGRDLDDVLFQHFKKPFQSKSSSKTLLNKCIDLKKKLSKSEKSSVTIDYFQDMKDYELAISRSSFERLAANIFNRAIDIVKSGLHDVGWNNLEVDKIILVGGTTRVPRIRELLKKYFSGKEFCTDFSPDEAVAAGASLQAYRLQNYNEYLEKYKISEVTPLSLGLLITENLMKFVISRNTSLPVKQTTLVRTSINNQSSALLGIYEGERKRCNLNNKLGEFTITGLPLKHAGAVEINVTFHLDEDGILTVTAQELSTNKTEQLIVTMGEFRLSEKKIKVSIEKSRKMKYEDDAFEEFMILMYNMKTKIELVKYDIERIPTSAEQMIVREACSKFSNKIHELDFTEKDRLEALFKIFDSEICDILKKYNLLQIKSC